MADTKSTLVWLLKDEVSATAGKVDQKLDSLGKTATSSKGGLAGLAGGLTSLINPTTLAIGGVAALTAGLVSGFASAKETQKLNAQTAAALKSTGNAANVTADHVSDLAQSISDYSGIDDQAVQAGENLLLTFTNVKNEAGAGNDIFDQSTAILADMATAMGTDVSSQAIQLGKALNDPIAGIGALSRVGVTFTDEQKDMIKSMMDAGDTAGAQKVIMAELTKEFGGSAKAAGDTADGAFKKLQNKMGDMFEAVATALLPVLSDLATFFVDTVIPAAEDVADVLGPVLGVAFSALGTVISGVIDNFVKPAITVLQTMFGWVKDVLEWLGILDKKTPAGPAVGSKEYASAARSHRRASGGPVDPYGVYTVGERGPETLVMGSRPGQVIPNGGLSSSTAGGFTIQGVSERQIVDMVDRGLYFKLQRAAPTATRT